MASCYALNIEKKIKKVKGDCQSNYLSPSEVEKTLEGLVNSRGLNSVSLWSLNPAAVCQHISYLFSSSIQVKLKSFLDLHESLTHTKPCMYLLDLTEILRCDWGTEQFMLSKSKGWCSDRTARIPALEHPSPTPGTLHWVLGPCFGPPPRLPALTFCPGLLPRVYIFLIFLHTAILFSPASNSPSHTPLWTQTFRVLNSTKMLSLEQIPPCLQDRW